MRKTLLITMLVFVLVFSAVSFVGAEDTIKIGALQDTSGSTAAWGQGMVNGSQMAIEEINARGGLLGREVELVVYDHKNEVNEAINVYQRMVNRDNVSAVIGPPTSNIGIA